VVLEEGDLCRFGCAFTTAFGRAVRALRGWVDGLSEDRPFRVGVSGDMVHAASGVKEDGGRLSVRAVTKKVPWLDALLGMAMGFHQATPRG